MNEEALTQQIAKNPPLDLKSCNTLWRLCCTWIACLKLNTSFAGQVKDKMNGWIARIGDWELFDKDYYRNKKGVVKHGQTIPYDNPTVNSIKPISEFCL